MATATCRKAEDIMDNIIKHIPTRIQVRKQIILHHDAGQAPFRVGMNPGSASSSHVE